MTPEWLVQKRRVEKAEKAVEFYNRLGRFPSSSLNIGSKEERKCYTWLLKARNRYKDSDMTDEELDVFKAAPVLYKYIISDSAQWERHRKEFIEFLKENKMSPCSTGDGRELCLYEWLHNTRAAYNKGKISSEMQQKMDEISPIILRSNNRELMSNINKWIMQGMRMGCDLEDNSSKDDVNSLLNKGLSNLDINLLAKCGIRDVQTLVEKIKEASYSRIELGSHFNTQSLDRNEILFLGYTENLVILSKRLGIPVNKPLRLRIITDELTEGIFKILDSTYVSGAFELLQVWQEKSIPQLINSGKLDGISKKLVEKVSKLGTKYRTAIEQYYFKGNILTDVSNELKVSRETVRTWIMEGVKQLDQ